MRIRNLIKNEKKLFITLAFIIVACVIWIFTFRNVNVELKPVYSVYNFINNKWHIKYLGDKLGIVNLPHINTLEENSRVEYIKSLPYISEYGDNIAILADCDRMTVKVGNKIIYDYKGVDGDYIKGGITSSWHMLSLDKEYSYKKIIITLDNMNNQDIKVGLRDAFIGTRNEIYYSIISKYSLEVTYLILLLSMGVILLIINVILYSGRQKRNLSLYISLLCLSMFGWISGNGGRLASFFIPRRIFMRVFTMTSAFSMSLILIFVIAYLYREKYYSLFSKWKIVNLVVYILFLIMIIFGKLTYTKAGIVIPISITITLVIAVVIYLKELRNEIKRKNYDFVTIMGLSLLMISLDLYIYCEKGETAFSNTIIALLIWSVYAIILSVKKIFAQVEEREKLSYYKEKSMKDNLTGLFNRNAYNYYIKDYIKKKNTKIKDFNVALTIDLNNLKKINDTYGHSAGNDAIIEVGNIVNKIFDGKNYVKFRMGGDEFLVLGKVLDEEEIKAKIQKVKEEIKEKGKRKSYDFSAALGYSVIINEKDENPLIKVISRSDKEMYEDKKAYKGKNR